MKKKKISPYKIKFLSSLVITTTIIFLELILMNSVMTKMKENAEKQYFESCTQVLEGYSRAVYFYLESYMTSLDSVNTKKLFLTHDKDKIMHWLTFNKPLLHEDFYSIFFVDFSTKKCYISHGITIDLEKDENFFRPEAFNGVDYHISDIHKSKYLDEPVIFIEIPVYADDGTLEGILGGAIELHNLEHITEQIKIGSGNNIYLLDKADHFLVAPTPDMIGTKYSNAEPNTIKTEPFPLPKDSPIGTLNIYTSNGTTVPLLYRKLPVSNWTMALSFHSEGLEKITKRLQKFKIIIILISVSSMFILLVIERYVLKHFYKKQQIESIYDPLTSLITRQRFETEAARWMKHYPKTKFMLIESDIRGFKFINQNYGEEEADKIIQFYSSLLRKMTLKYKGLIAHGYADHFYSFMKVKNVRRSMRLFKEGMEEISVDIRNYKIPFFPKFGITFLRPESRKNVTIKELIGQVSFAKSTIKDNFLEPYAIYNSRLLDRINELHFMENNMESALTNQEFFVMYQPKILLANDKVVGAEALVRWKTSEGKILPPDKFIPVFERNGFITKLDFYVYDKVFQFLERELKAGNPIVPISVNMSRNHNKPEKFMQEFTSIFKKYNIPASLIQVELLERSVMNNNTLKDITDRLHKEGFSVAMDDFGSGESSLNMLTKVPVDTLKFDKDFLRSSTKESGLMDEKSEKFIRSLIDLSKNLEKQTIFEGVETEAQRDFLKAAECDQVQGYFYSKPLSEEDFIEFLKTHI